MRHSSQVLGVHLSHRARNLSSTCPPKPSQQPTLYSVTYREISSNLKSGDRSLFFAETQLQKLGNSFATFNELYRVAHFAV